MYREERNSQTSILEAVLQAAFEAMAAAAAVGKGRYLGDN